MLSMTLQDQVIALLRTPGVEARSECPGYVAFGGHAFKSKSCKRWFQQRQSISSSAPLFPAPPVPGPVARPVLEDA
jgi:hypothetical protein